MGMSVLFIFALVSSVLHISSPCCEKKERITVLLDTAMDLLSKVKLENITCEEGSEGTVDTKENNTCGAAVDCADLYKRGFKKSGVYTIQPNSRLTSMKRLGVYCDMTTDGGGWTVIQKRGNFGRAKDYFDRDWENYKNGFGDLEKDFWLGNDNIFAVTNQRLYSVRFDLEDKEQNTSFARYNNFWIDDEFNNYTLHISGYSGTAGDAMKYHNEMKFTTKDRDNGLWKGDNCARAYNSGWWYNSCYSANLNGQYYNSTHGIIWLNWRNLPKAEIKIRPLTF